jgi:hypothetical protein
LCLATYESSISRIIKWLMQFMVKS